MMGENKAYKILSVPEIGMQARVSSVSLKPTVIVIMGGLSMPNVSVKVEKVKAVISKHPDAQVMGFCFMHMFEKAGWLTTISFDCLIDVMIDPVEVTTKS